MKLKITKETEIELEFPLYLKHKLYDIYVFAKDEKSKILVNYGESLSALSNLSVLEYMDYQTSTETEFKKAFNKTNKYLKSLI